MKKINFILGIFLLVILVFNFNKLYYKETSLFETYGAVKNVHNNLDFNKNRLIDDIKKVNNEFIKLSNEVISRDLIFDIKFNNTNQAFYGKYKVNSIIDMSPHFTNSFKTDEEALNFYDSVRRNFSETELLNSIVEINDNFIKLNDEIILENPKYEISIIPSVKSPEFYFYKIPTEESDIINEEEPYFIYVKVLNFNYDYMDKSKYLESFYLNKDSIVLDSGGAFYTTYNAIKIDNINQYNNNLESIKFEKYTDHIFYGEWELNYNNEIYNIKINEDILKIPYKIKILKPFDLNDKEKNIFNNSSISNVICIEFNSMDMLELYDLKIKKMYVLNENNLIIEINDNFYNLNRLDSIDNYNYSNGV